MSTRRVHDPRHSPCTSQCRTRLGCLRCCIKQHYGRPISLATSFLLANSIVMTIRARQLTKRVPYPSSWIRIESRQACDLAFEIADNVSGIRVDWAGHQPRFRVYSQVVDNAVVVEVTDPQRCAFEQDGIWRLRLTAEETELLPLGGMRFTLEHREPQGEYLQGIQGGFSCCDSNRNDVRSTAMSLADRPRTSRDGVGSWR